MKKFRQYAALITVFTLIGAGCILLALDYGTVSSAWAGLVGALVCLTGGLILGLFFDRKKMFPE